MTIAQQARDAAAIIKAIGNDKAIIFGSSGGGIISLELAAVDFIATLVGAPDIPYPQERVSGNMDFFFKHEYRSFIQYITDVKRIKENKVNMVTAAGRDSDDAHYVQSTRALASKLRCKCIEFPGQHDISFYMPQEFSNAIRRRWNRGMTDLVYYTY